jgi:HlyD family secretion protein
VVEQKQAALDQAEVDRERTQIRSPIDGVIIKRDVNPGQTVAVTLEARTLFKVAHDLREMEVRGRIDEADVGKLSVKSQRLPSMHIRIGYLRGGFWKLEISRNDPKCCDVHSGHFRLQSRLLLLPGMTATLQIAVSETDSTLKIASQALRFRPSGQGGASAAAQASGPSTTIWVLDESGTASVRQVLLGKTDGNSIQSLERQRAARREGHCWRRHAAQPHGWLGLAYRILMIRSGYRSYQPF